MAEIQQLLQIRQFYIRCSYGRNMERAGAVEGGTAKTGRVVYCTVVINTVGIFEIIYLLEPKKI
jgi:hypothetical protein